MIEKGCTIALIAYVSAGIYASNDHRPKIQKDYENIVNEILSKECITISGKKVVLGQYFYKVILTKLSIFIKSLIKYVTIIYNILIIKKIEFIIL